MSWLVAFMMPLGFSDRLSAAWNAESRSSAVQAGQVGMATYVEALPATVQHVASSLVAGLDISTVIEVQEMRAEGLPRKKKVTLELAEERTCLADPAAGVTAKDRVS